VEGKDAGAAFVVVPDSIDCGFAELLISRRVDGELAPDDSPLLDAHLAACPACRERDREWLHQSSHLNDNMTVLWPETPKPKPRLKNQFWLPLGVIASQAAALVGIAIYLNFFATSAQAPKLSHDDPRILQRKSHQSGAQKPALFLPSDAPQDALPVSTVADAVPPFPAIPVIETLAAFVPPPLAAMREVLIPKLIPNVSIEYTLADPAGGAAISGRMDVLGDIINDRAVIRIRDSKSGIKDIAQGDINALLQDPERRVARRLVAACQTPELRKRFEEILRQHAAE